jgi:hypothetical protein
VVVDVILTPQVLDSLTDTLLMSNIWFDLTDGWTFMAHNDDGLVHEVFKSLARNVAGALSPASSSPPSLSTSPENSEIFRVVKYRAVVMSLLETHSSPLAIGMYTYP